jgi:hypothetical protein
MGPALVFWGGHRAAPYQCPGASLEPLKPFSLPEKRGCPHLLCKVIVGTGNNIKRPVLGNYPVSGEKLTRKAHLNTRLFNSHQVIPSSRCIQELQGKFQMLLAISLKFCPLAFPKAKGC